MKLIIYPNETGISVIVSVGKLAIKDVPTGVKYKIIENTDLPSNRDFRNAWEYDFTTDFDGVGA